MDTECVRLFVKAAEMLNISAAGRSLDIAPAVASARLAKLEGQVGADLLHRSTRKVALSLAGEEFLPFAREILAQEDAARAALGQGAAEVTGSLRFAAPSTFAQLYIAPLLPKILDAYPKVDLQLMLSDTQVDLIQGGYDLALRNLAIEESGLRARRLADDKRILCASPEYLRRFGTPRRVEDLNGHRILDFAGPARKLRTRDGVSDGVFPPTGAAVRVVCDDGASIRRATTAGAGVSMNALWSVWSELRKGDLVRVLPNHEVDDASAIWLVYPKANVLTAKVRAMIDFLRREIGDPPPWEAD